MVVKKCEVWMSGEQGKKLRIEGTVGKVNSLSANSAHYKRVCFVNTD